MSGDDDGVPGDALPGDAGGARDEACVGRVGVLTVGTRGENGPGEVHVKVRGGTETFLAWSERPLPRGDTVLIIASRGQRAVDVIAWEDPLGDSPRLG